MEAQADLSLSWVHMSEDIFSHIEAYTFIIILFSVS